MRWLCFVGLLLAIPRPSRACECEPPPPVCEAMWRVDAVFAGKVMQIVPVADAVHVTMSVDELIRGAIVTRTVEVQTSGDGGSCGFEFHAGESYLVYGRSSGKAYTTGMCSGTKPLADATQDLAYGRAMPKRARAVLAGDITIRELGPASKVEVRAHGTNDATTTGADGKFQLELLPGTYQIDVTGAGLLPDDTAPLMVELPSAAACAVRSIAMDLDGRIRGRITDVNGQPIADLAVGADGITSSLSGWHPRARTNANGEYELHRVPPGVLLVGASSPGAGGPEIGHPYPPTYYAGVATDKAATPVAMAPAGIVDHIDFAMPKALAVYDVSGVIRTKAGKPAGKANLNAHDDTFSTFIFTEVNDRGEYAFKAFAGSMLRFELCTETPSHQRTCKELHRRADRSFKLDFVLP